MNSGKAAEHKLFWIGNEKGLGGIALIWVDKVIDINWVSD